jgi:hypothetical protein
MLTPEGFRSKRKDAPPKFSTNDYLLMQLALQLYLGGTVVDVVGTKMGRVGRLMPGSPPPCTGSEYSFALRGGCYNLLRNVAATQPSFYHPFTIFCY